MLCLSDKQKEYWKYAGRRWNIKQGATRSGKTYLDYYIIPRRIRACKGQGLILLLGNTKGTLTRNILDPMRSIWGDGLVGNIGSDNTVRLFGHKCYALGADKVTQVSKLQGAGIEYCYGDEVTTWNEDVFSMLKSRLSCENSCFDGTCNPDSPSHWFKAFLDSDADIFQQSYTIYDNPFLPKMFVENLEREYAGTVFDDRFILGLWAIAEGLVYSMFDKQKHITDGSAQDGRYYISIDYGTANPFSAGLWCVNTERAVRLREFYFDSRKRGRQCTDEEYYEQLESLAGDKRIDHIVVDPSAASFIETVRRHGKYSVKKAVNDVLDGIRTTASLINAGKVLIHSSCTDAIREFGSYAWDDKATEDKVIKENDHAMDEIRYFCHTILRREYRWGSWVKEDVQ